MTGIRPGCRPRPGARNLTVSIMSKRVPILLILAAAGVVATPAAGTQMGFADYPVAPEYRPATALDPMAVARTVETAAGRRIAVRNGDQPPVLIGPGTRGDDGAPAMARTENRDLILVDSDLESLLARFEQYESPVTEAWLDPSKT